MLSRIVRLWNPVVIGLGRPRMFHISTSLMDKSMERFEQLKVDSKNDKDHLTTIIKSAITSYALLDIISRNVKKFTPGQTTSALRTLFQLQKDKSTSIGHKDLVHNSDFRRLCETLKRNARFMELNDVIDALKVISFFDINPESEITMSLLHLIKEQINEATLGHILFLNFLFKRMKPNPLVDTLKLALPVLLQIQISSQIDHENVPQLAELLRFVSQHKVSDTSIMNIVSSLTIHGADLSLEQARSIVWSLSNRSFPMYNENCEKLLQNSIKAMCRQIDNEDITHLSTTFMKMNDKYFSNPDTFQAFYNETFCNKCADFVVMNDLGFEEAGYIQKQMNRLNFVNIKLLKYMLTKIEKYPEVLLESQPNSIITLVTALSQVNYKPENWNKIQDLILRSNLLTNEKRLSLPWVRFSIELLSLGIECPAIWDKLFSKEYYESLHRRYRKQESLRILELYQLLKVMTTYNVDNKIDEENLYNAKMALLSLTDHSMQKYLEAAYGGSSFVHTRVRTQLGHVIDHVIAFDKNTLAPVEISNGRNYDVFYEDITTDDATKKYIAVVSFPYHCYCRNMPILRGIYELKLRAYEKMGISVVVINPRTWNQLEDFEKIPYIQREVKLKLGQVQNVIEECQ